MKNILVKCLALLLSAVLLVSLTVPVFAATADSNTPKQEVVYINLNADGSVSEICVVNIFELDENGQIIDYGDYSALRNMTSNDEIIFENETVRIDTKAGKLYYEGTLNKNVIPWIFSFRYYLDGVEYKADEIAGKDGALKITVSIRQNPDCDSTFFENYGLQASVTLDTELCKNIVADGSTAANVGKNRQLTYTILPGTEKNIEITADVTDFEMTAIAINGLPLNMEIDIDGLNSGELADEINKLKDAVNDLDNGADELKDGAENLRDGASELKKGITSLNNGADELVVGAEELNGGADAVYAGAEALNSGANEILNGSAELSAGASALNSGAETLYGGIENAANGVSELSNGLTALSGNSVDLRYGAYTMFLQLIDTAEAQLNQSLVAAGLSAVTLTPDTYAQTLSAILANLPTESESYQMISALKQQLDSYNTFYLGLTQYTEGVDSAAAGAEELKNGFDELKKGSSEIVSGAATLKGGIENLHNGIVSLENGTTELLAGVTGLKAGTATLYSGASELSNGISKLLSGATTLYNGSAELYNGTVTLKDGTLKFKEETDGLEDELKNKINDAVGSILGGDFEVISFVSDKNKNVESVQFVIKSEAISIPEAPVVEVPAEEKLTFWQKLLRLFGLN